MLTQMRAPAVPEYLEGHKVPTPTCKIADPKELAILTWIVGYLKNKQAGN